MWPKDAGIAPETAQQRLRDGYQEQIRKHMAEQGVRLYTYRPIYIGLIYNMYTYTCTPFYPLVCVDWSVGLGGRATAVGWAGLDVQGLMNPQRPPPPLNHSGPRPAAASGRGVLGRDQHALPQAGLPGSARGGSFYLCVFDTQKAREIMVGA